MGKEEKEWREYDEKIIIEEGNRLKEIIVDKGKEDGLIDEGMRKWMMEEDWRKEGIEIKIKMREGYEN